MVDKHFAASALVFHNKKVLLVHHKKLNTWIYPGGHVESSEAPDESVIREVFEECGIQIELINIHRNLNMGNSNVRTVLMPLIILEESIKKKGVIDHFHVDFVYLAKVRDDQEVQVEIDQFNPRETYSMGWFEPSSLEKLDMFPDVRLLATEGFRIIENVSYSR